MADTASDSLNAFKSLHRAANATYVKVREAGRIVSVAVIVAVGVNGEGRREVLGMARLCRAR